MKVTHSAVDCIYVESALILGLVPKLTMLLDDKNNRHYTVTHHILVGFLVVSHCINISYFRIRSLVLKWFVKVRLRKLS